jgi:hypothetical protein
VNNSTTGTAVQFLPERTFLPPEPYTNNLGVLRNWGTSPEPVPDAHTIDPPSRFCDKHPMGYRGKCGDCGNARTAFNAWQSAQAQRDVAIQLAEDDREQRRRQAIADCRDCDGRGLIEVDDNSQAWCTHQGRPPLRAVGNG